VAFTLTSVTPGTLQLLANFNADVLCTPGIYDDPDNYSVVPVVPSSSSSVKVISVTTTADPAVLLVETSDFTKDRDYTLTIVTHVLQDIAFNFLDAPNNTATFTATSESPIVQRIYATDEFTIRVEFSKEMARADIDDITKYQFDNNLRVTKVTIVSNSVIDLTTSKQTPSLNYILEIVP